MRVCYLKKIVKNVNVAGNACPLTWIHLLFTRNFEFQRIFIDLAGIILASTARIINREKD